MVVMYSMSLRVAGREAVDAIMICRKVSQRKTRGFIASSVPPEHERPGKMLLCTVGWEKKLTSDTSLSIENCPLIARLKRKALSYTDLNWNETVLPVTLGSSHSFQTAAPHETLDHGFEDFPADDIHPYTLSCPYNTNNHHMKEAWVETSFECNEDGVREFSDLPC
jgi:hypothetical protein